jgi:hypothetical protein
MKVALSMLAAAVLAVAGPASAHDEPGELLEQGYRAVLRFGYAEVTECTPDKPVRLGDYVFLCSGYEYPYHYGSAFIASKGRLDGTVYLCWSNKCLRGRLVAIR